MSILVYIFLALFLLSLLVLMGFDAQVVAFIFGAVVALIMLWVLFWLAPFVVMVGIPVLLVVLVFKFCGRSK